MFERFTDRARRVLVLAQEEARLLNHNFIGTEHILLGLIHEGEGVAAKALESLGISLEAVREKVEETIGPPARPPPARRRSRPGQEGARAVTARGAAARPQLHRHRAHAPRPGPRGRRAWPPRCSSSLGADLSRVRQQVIQLLSGYAGGKEGAAAGTGTSGQETPSGSPVLDQFGRNLTQLAREKKLDPVIGREREIERVMQVLSAPHQEQPRPHRRARRGQDRHRRGPGAAHRRQRRARDA